MMNNFPLTLLTSLVLLNPLQALAEELSIELSTTSGVIKGTLTTPKAGAKVPVALIIAGSGPTDRDGNSKLLPGKNDSLKMLASALAGAGIASVRYDKRGIGESAASIGSESNIRFEDYVHDATAWVAQLAADNRFTGVTVIGHSEGSLIGMLAAQQSSTRAYVSIAGVSDGAASVLRRQISGKLPASLVQINEDILTALEGGYTFESVPPQLNSLYRPSVQPYLLSWFKYVPKKELAKLKIPCLILQGDTDIQVQVEDAEALHKAAPNCEISIITGMNHVMKSVSAGQPNPLASYSDPLLPLNAQLSQNIIQLITTQLGGKAR